MNQKSIVGGSSVFKTLVSFSVPYFLSCFMQILYGMADLFIIGQFGDVSGTAAVSAGSQVMHMLTVMIVGLAMGSTVLIGKASGAGEKERTSLAVGNTVSLFLVLSLVITAVSGESDRFGNVYAVGRGAGNNRIPDNMLFGNSVYNRV